MTRVPQTFRQRDLTRAIRAAKAAKVFPFRVSVNKSGRIDVIVGDKPHNGPVPQENNEWDGV
jgi:hypothetical protein